MTQIGFLGLGNMGGPMSANLVAAGHAVRGFDPVPAAQDAARAAGIEVVDSAIAAATGVDIVITMLPDGALVSSTYAEILPAATAGTLLIDSSTISVDDARAVNAAATAAGMRQIDAPVSGGVKGAAAGTLAFMVGGADADVDAAREVLDVMGAKTVHCGGPGAGQAAKVCNNMLLAVQQIAVGEAFVLAEELGLSARSLFDVVTGATGNCWSIHTNCPVPGPVPTSPANRDFTPGFAAALMLKDLGLARDALESTGVDARMGGLAAELYGRFVEEGGGGRDFSAVIEQTRKDSK